MKLDAGTLRLSASDLANHLGCRHLTQLDRRAAMGGPKRPVRNDPALALLQERGLAHEAAYVAHLASEGRTVVDLNEFAGNSAIERTRAAMHEGADVIVQAELRRAPWGGRADLLLRVDGESRLGQHAYEVADTKLAQETRGGTVLQLLLYSELVADVQGALPEAMHVVKPGEPFAHERFRVAEFQAYHRLILQRLQAEVAAAPDGGTYPDPVPHCDVCAWWSECRKRRVADDHLSLVAGMQAAHIAELGASGVATLEGFAERASALDGKPQRGSLATFERLHGQARVQLEGRRRGKPYHERLPLEPERGLHRLPAPDPGDVFFDIEGDPYVDGGGLEYLLGYAAADDDGSLAYTALWAHGRVEERRAFEEFIDFVMARWERHPAMHVYHYAPYEPGAMKRLMGRYASRGAEVDRLLRGGRFVDLFAVARQGVRASVERYSLKDLEPFFGYERDVDLREASRALRRVSCALEAGRPGEITPADRSAVEVYNRDDCLATEALRVWLEAERAAMLGEGHEITRPLLKDGLATDEADARDAAVQELFDALVAGLPDDPGERSGEQQARWVLAHLLEYFRREQKSSWWEYFRLHDLAHEDLLDERQAVAGLRFVSEVEGGTAKCPIHRYEFPPQEVALHRKDSLEEVGVRENGGVGSVAALHLEGRWLDIKKKQTARDRHPHAVLVRDPVRPKPLDERLLELGSEVARHGIDGDGRFRAARDILLARPPRFAGGPAEAGEPLRRGDETAVDAAVRLSGQLDGGALAIQGPPGTGKTFSGARMIVELVRAGKRVGVTAVSHKVIRNLLDAVLEAAAKAGVSVEAVHKTGGKDDDLPAGLQRISDNAKALAALDDGKVVGGTAWLWAREGAREKLDYLVVDEAGQMSLAHVLPAACAARNVILLGDPQQLEQPQKGAHPEGADVAALVHLLGRAKTIPTDQGLFLDVTWRLHPSICTFTSELYYEGRLLHRTGLERQGLAGSHPFAGSGLFHVPVAHRVNQSRSPEEVEAVARIVGHLLGAGSTWTSDEGVSAPLRVDDILIVAPYNAQVAALAERLPGMHIGTVDKFQGQQAPVVVYSMTSSSAEDAPRGMSFLYSPNRLNVATSRARCACILVASPRLFEPECQSPTQMRWANGVCRFRELAQEVAL